MILEACKDFTKHEDKLKAEWPARKMKQNDAAKTEPLMLNNFVTEGKPTDISANCKEFKGNFPYLTPNEKAWIMQGVQAQLLGLKNLELS